MIQGVYTPSAIDAKALSTYKTEISAINANMYKELNTTLYSFREASAAGALPQLTDADWVRLNSTFAAATKSIKAVADPAKAGTGMHDRLHLCLTVRHSACFEHTYASTSAFSSI